MFLEIIMEISQFGQSEPKEQSTGNHSKSSSHSKEIQDQVNFEAAKTKRPEIVCGQVYKIRRLGALTFVMLRTCRGLEQLVIEKSELAAAASEILPESSLKVKGKWVEQEKKAGTYEMQVESLQILNKAGNSLPVEISKEKKMESLNLSSLLEYRPLTLRNQKVRAIFKIEAELCRAFREFLNKEGFTEIHSPKIVATGTEGGAALFELDYFGRTAYLAQSPQFYKQIMVGVFERVYEIASVYRAEEHSTPRHLNEYVSMDFEMGFIENEQTLISLQSKMLAFMFEALRETCPEELALFNCSPPEIGSIPQMKLEEAVETLRSKLGWQGEGEDLDPEAERLICTYMEQSEGSPFVYLTHYPWSTRPFYALPEKGSSKSHSFDLLFRGLEITTGGQRIHEYAELLESIEKRSMQVESFADYLQCFKYGMPPHGGLAIGLERLVKQLLQLRNVREASLFPRDRTRISP